MATELSDWFFTTRISAHILCVEKFKMAMRFSEPIKAEIVVLVEKATPEDAKKFLTVCI